MKEIFNKKTKISEKTEEKKLYPQSLLEVILLSTKNLGSKRTIYQWRKRIFKEVYFLSKL